MPRVVRQLLKLSFLLTYASTQVIAQAQEEQWEELSDAGQREAIQSLMDAGEYDHAATLANEAITEAVARYLHDAMLEKEERQEECEDA